MKGGCLTSHAKSTIIKVTPCPSRNLCQLIRLKLAHATAVKFGQARKGDMFDIKVQPHPDGVCGHQKINIAVLIKLNLRVARPRTERPHDHSSAAFLPAQHLCNCIDIIDRKTDNRTSVLHTADLFGACVRQRRKPFALEKLHFWHQGGNGRLHCLRAHKERLTGASRVQQPIGENMPAVQICAQLYLINGNKICTNAHRHRLNRTHPKSSPIRDNTFFARDQCNNIGTAQLNQPVIHLAR